MRRPAVLVIAATDSSGGAGLTRDVRVLADFGVDALCAVTAVTAQTDQRVVSVHYAPPEVIRAQIAAALETRPVGAVKIGMLGDRATVEAVADALAFAAAAATNEAAELAAPVVLDPVLVSSSGGILLDAPGRAALLEKLLPRATLVTPNVLEVAALLGEPVAADAGELLEQGRRLLRFGPRAILLKGGHASGDEAVDWLIRGGTGGAGGPRGGGGAAGAGHDRCGADRGVMIDRIPAKRVSGSSRGTGCALASGIAAGLASGLELLEACRRAKSYVLEKMLAPATHTDARHVKGSP